MQKTHVIAASHGTDNLQGQQLIHELRAQLEDLARTSGDTELVWHEAYVDVQQPQLPQVLGSLPAGEPAVVLPLLVADGVHTTEDIAQAVAARPHTVAASPLGASAELAQLLSRRALAELKEGQQVVLVAAGTRLTQGQQQIGQLAELVSTHLRQPVSVAYCAGAEPLVTKIFAEQEKSQTLLLSVLLADGLFQTRVANTGAAVVTSPLLPDVMIAQCFLRRLQEALKQCTYLSLDDELRGE